MLVYWLLFAYFAIGVFLRRGIGQTAPRFGSAFIVIGAAALALLVGLRYEVGADWLAYERMFFLAGYADIQQVLQGDDPAYQWLNFVVQLVGGDIWLVNLACGSIFSWGLLKFARSQPDPWLAMLIAIPYLVVVVAMGYSRQAVAIGLLMAGLGNLTRGASILKFSLYVSAAALFHKTAVVGLLFVLLRGKRNLLFNMMFILASLLLLYDLLLQDSIEAYVENYIDSEYGSQGAFIRVAMSIVPAALFLLYKQRFQMTEDESALWRNFSLASFGLLFLLLILPSSTVVDRLALYVLPLQLAILSRVPGSLFTPALGRFIIVTYSFFVQFVWLNFAAHAEYWLPYRIHPW